MKTTNPVANGCYLGKDHAMYRVRLVRYVDEGIDQILVEDQYGITEKMDSRRWDALELVPCCFLGDHDPNDGSIYSVISN